MINKKTRFKILASSCFFILFVLLMLFMFSGGNFELLKSIFLEEHTNEELREKLADFGVRGYITIAVLSMLQVVFTFLPAEPVQVLAGLTFGFPIGLACCAAGVLLGNTLIYILYRVYGERIREYFVKNLHFDFDKAATSAKATIIILILYFLPAIPYGMICFFAASLGMKYPRFIAVTLAGAIPSICIGVGLGHIAISSSWVVSLIIFVLIVALLIVVMIKRDAIFAKVNSYADKPPYSSKTTVRKYSPKILAIAYVVSRIVFFLKGVKVRYTNKLGSDVESPSIVLCNHGSFIDFAYAGSLIRRKSPNFIVARLYFYNKLVGNFLRRLGCFPKSMFAADIESAKNCVKVLKSGGVLAMMPEARLSTVGKFEDIQKGTYAFLQRAGVPIYTIKIHGDYLADPKWGNGLRRGSLIEAELDILFTAEEIQKLSTEEIEKAVTDRLYYDEFEWIKSRQDVRYRSKKLAEGLENVLSKCPKCKQKYTITTKDRDVFCEKCGKLATLDDRYSFVGGQPFSNFSEWYDWQKKELEGEILGNDAYSLSSAVELRMPSDDGKSFLRSVGRGVCTLDKSGLTYKGQKDGEAFEISFHIGEIYRLLFGAGESFEIYVGRQMYFFLPDEGRSAVDWYMASSIIVDEKEGIL